MLTLKRLFLFYLIFAMSGCGIIPLSPDSEVLQNLDPAMAKSILQANCPTCNNSTIGLSCDNGYFIDAGKTQSVIEYPYHNLVVICYSGYLEVKGRQTDCVSSNGKSKLPQIELKVDQGKKLCNATFSVINHAREQRGIGTWDYYSQKAEPEK